jgi:hypothetical protein
MEFVLATIHIGLFFLGEVKFYRDNKTLQSFYRVYFMELG